MQRQLRFLFRLLFHWLTCVEVVGLEKVPLSGGCILASNHLSRLDPPLLFMLIERDDLTALVADKYKKYPLIPWLVRVLKGIWLNREEADFRALKDAIRFLEQGGLLGIAPEGTRSPTKGLLPGKPGVAYLADKTGVPVIPVAISGTEGAIFKILTLRRPKIRVVFGDPVQLPPVERERREEMLQRNTEEILCRIAALLPPEYRGVYADHPRLKEILAGVSS
ncbi:MAG: lysophospholipid acyltransferase family protein [Anaerolineales bacterium]|nr:1-acyl-sn-glycerol-3-phosphate acyltransferase [Anaerolineales bacterium]MCS7248242.1 1-acyl-sn-glycerol-3-phosphate acyltransferase [Anaerolineales bacterium]MDW8162056.1 lysophospholipid acyltransferase family protein [Anaerolineales bacterium]MDW8448144.1 lysophospholipid acyltransferase family protein [Anaerolineales bacterium]